MERQAFYMSAYFSATYDEKMKQIVAMALDEDLGPGDVTACIFQDETPSLALLIAREWGVLSGSKAVENVFKQLYPTSIVRRMKQDGEAFTPGDLLIEIEAPVRILLAGERTALNFIQRLSGVASMTRKFVEALGGDSRIGIYDTRKTTPMMRSLQKMAVVHGGGCNHRFGLYDMAMIKNNHIDALGSVEATVMRLKEHVVFENALSLCFEARNFSEATAALRCGADIIMLDNMPVSLIRASVQSLEKIATEENLKMPQIEVSGNVTLDNIYSYKDLPIDRISIGALTHSAPSVDVSMRLV